SLDILLLLILYYSFIVYSFSYDYCIVFLSLLIFFSFFFFFMIRLPPISTLFPTRRSSDLYFLRINVERRFIYIGKHRRRPNPSEDRKSTRLNSSHVSISYAVFCLKKKKKTKSERYTTHKQH